MWPPTTFRRRDREPPHVGQSPACRFQPPSSDPDGRWPGAEGSACPQARRSPGNRPRSPDRALHRARDGAGGSSLRPLALGHRAVRVRGSGRRKTGRRGPHGGRGAEGLRRDGARSHDSRGELPALGRRAVPSSLTGPGPACGRPWTICRPDSSRPAHGTASSASWWSTPPIATLPRLRPTTLCTRLPSNVSSPTGVVRQPCSWTAASSACSMRRTSRPPCAERLPVSASRASRR